MCDSFDNLGDGVTAVNAELSTGDVAGRIRRQESDSAHEILRLTHLALRDKRRPLVLQVGVLIEDLLRAVVSVSVMAQLQQDAEDLQSRQHVAGADGVHTNASVRPLDSQTGS